MKPSVEDIKASLQSLGYSAAALDERLCVEHLSRLDSQYFEAFPLQEVSRHIAALQRLTKDNFVEILWRSVPGEGGEDLLELTVLGFDYPGLFSLITGALAGKGFSIRSGDVFTYAAAREKSGKRASPLQTYRRRRIVDRFIGILLEKESPERFVAELKQVLSEALKILEAEGEAGAVKAKHKVNEMVASTLRSVEVAPERILYPLKINVDNQSGPFTILKVTGQDTPAFLYALSAALDLRGVTVERVRIRTIGRRVEDEIHVLYRGSKIENQEEIDKLKLVVVLCKQFTYFLPGAPDPYAALCRFDHLVQQLLSLPESGKWVELLSSPEALRDLARLLGTSDFIWEDLLRQQYEALLPALQRHAGDRRFSRPPEDIEKELRAYVNESKGFEEAVKRLNEFKDREIFLIDLDHILRGGWRVTELARALTALAEAVVRVATDLVYQQLKTQFGEPRSVAGFPAKFAAFGLGKFGGAALGYASDIELLFVYSDAGKTEGPRTIENSEFFERLVKAVVQAIRAKREGIFHVDLRLRPHGQSGPLACSLRKFCEYYGPKGQAHAFERLALVRLRKVAGDPDFGAQVERLRDQFVYESGEIDVEALKKLRASQLKEKVPPGRLNAKFSSGALVDLEYDVQLLQVKFGRQNPRLRTALLHEALRELVQAKVLAENEAKALTEAYFFLRKLINALRVLRGSARDLFLPPADSDEYVHLARRMGYSDEEGLTAAQRLLLDFEAYTAQVRAFVERHFGRDFLPVPAAGSVADLILSRELKKEACQAILSKVGFTDPSRAERNFRSLASRSGKREEFARLAILACDYLSRSPDPDMALNNWDRFVKAQKNADKHYELLLNQPVRLEILLKLFAASQYLADTLIADSGLFEWLTNPKTLKSVKTEKDFGEDLKEIRAKAGSRQQWLKELREFKRREVLRIGTKDFCLEPPLEEVCLELTSLAEACIKQALEGVWAHLRESGKLVGLEEPEKDFCLLALGKLGGRELNYSSDVDLVGLCQATGADSEVALYRQVFDRVMELLRSDLSERTPEGYVYRVDLRLRPYGRAGHLTGTLRGLVRYYREEASFWEIQALLKARPVAGNLELGRAFLEEVRPLLLKVRDKREVAGLVRSSIEKRYELGWGPKRDRDLKFCPGGIRDIEFLVQALQLVYAHKAAEIITGNTIEGIDRLTERGFLREADSIALKEDYRFLRKLEHCLQILEDRQTYKLPNTKKAWSAFAKRLLGSRAGERELRESLEEIQRRVREAWETYLS